MSIIGLLYIERWCWLIIFISDKFMFNGVHSDDMGVSLVTFDSNTFNPYGLSYSQEITLESTKNGSSYFSLGQETVEEIELNLVLNDRNNNPITWDDNTIMEISDWLITDSFEEFISEDNVDLIYYFKVKKIVKNFTSDRLGYLQLTIQPFSSFAYVKYYKKFVFNERKENTLTINNESSISEGYKPIIELKNLEDPLSIITIENTTTQKEPFMISGLDKNEEITIDGLMGTIYNNYNDYLLMKSNRKWLELKKGENVIKVIGKVEITIKCKFPIRV